MVRFWVKKKTKKQNNELKDDKDIKQSWVISLCGCHYRSGYILLHTSSYFVKIELYFLVLLQVNDVKISSITAGLLTS